MGIELPGVANAPVTPARSPGGSVVPSREERVQALLRPAIAGVVVGGALSQRGGTAEQGAQAVQSATPHTARGGRSGLMRNVGLAIAGTALVGTSIWVARNTGAEYGISLASAPDLSPAEQYPPRSPERLEAIHRITQEHFARESAAIVEVLDQLEEQGVVRSWEAFPANNSFQVEVAFRGRDDFLAALDGIPGVGEVARSRL